MDRSIYVCSNTEVGIGNPRFSSLVPRPRREDPMGGTPEGFLPWPGGRFPKRTALSRPQSPRSPRFGAKRRSDRMYARDRGAFANRNPAAHEVRDDEGSPMRFFFFRFLFDGQKEIGPPEAAERLQQQKKHTPPAGRPGRRKAVTISSGALVCKSRRNECFCRKKEK